MNAVDQQFLDLVHSDELVFLKDDDPSTRIKKLMANDGQLMKGHYLGACLDKTRWGSIFDCMWPVTLKGLVELIGKWVEVNKDRVPELMYGEKLNDFYPDVSVPYINHEFCPRHKEHDETGSYEDGTLRCTHRTVNWLKPSFVEEYQGFDSLAQCNKIEYCERPPIDYLPNEAYETGLDDFFKQNPCWKKDYERYSEQKAKFEKEELAAFTEVCFAIIREQDSVLPLEEVLRRKNLIPETTPVYCPGMQCSAERIATMPCDEKVVYDLSYRCPGHSEPDNRFIVGMDGWALAAYVQKWWEQTPAGRAPLFGKGRIAKEKFRHP